MAQNKRPIAFSYIRISSEAQAKGSGRKRQLEMSKNFAAARNLELDETFSLEDIGVSGFKGANAAVGEFGKILEAIKTGAIPPGSFLLVESLDRISRQQPSIALTTFMNIINAGITVVTLADNREYTAATVRLEDIMYSLVVMSRAHDESQMKSIRTKGAWKARRLNADSQKITRQVPFWLETSPDKKSFKLIEERVAIVRRVFSDAIAGIGAYTIARRLNEEGIPSFGRSKEKKWQISSIHKMIQGRAVLGEYQPRIMENNKRVPAGPVITDYFPAIIDEETFFAAQKSRLQRRTNSGGRKGVELTNLFSKLATCAYCHANMSFENKGGTKGGRYLVCSTALRGKGCCSTRWNYRDFETSFLTFVEELDLGSLFMSDADASQRAALETRVVALEGELLVAEQEEEAIYRLILQPGMDNSAIVAKKLQECAERKLKIAADLDVQRERLALTADVATRYYESKSDLKDLIHRIRDRTGPDAYKERAQIASRLRALLINLEVAPLGTRPIAEKTANSVAKIMRNEGVSNDEANAVLHTIQTPSPYSKRYFSALFRDGTFRVVYPSKADPMQYEQQIVRNGGEPEVLNADGSRSILIQTNGSKAEEFMRIIDEDPIP
ncbi:recombinase family protein [Bradyrhizobium sp. SYSU BS000235]|uniref:recombinase family protein n=1 Tax=Bradyrhizobium sp. SYSU BS000235 TaxID=3411332 RepID=UPI003C793847